MILLKDGVKYFLHEYVSEEELEQMVVEHYKDIFGISSLYFDPQSMKTQMGLEARNDGIILALDQNRWYILEVELAKHPLHEHIIPQITKFSIAYEESETRKKIINTLYTAIRQDAFKTAIIQTQKIEDLHKMLTDLIDIQPTIAIIIDQKTLELDSICRKLPFPTQTIEFKTYARENMGIGVHIHEFQTLLEKRILIRPKRVETAAPTRRERRGPSNEEVLAAMAEIKAANPDTPITSTLLRDQFGLNKETGRGIIRRIMRQLAEERKVQISEVGGEGKRKQYIYELVA